MGINNIDGERWRLADFFGWNEEARKVLIKVAGHSSPTLEWDVPVWVLKKAKREYENKKS